MNSNLKSTLDKSNAGLVSRNSIRQAVMNQHFEMKELMDLATDLSYKNHHKAIWIVEQIAIYDFWLVKPFLPMIVEKASAYKHTSAVRGVSKILYLCSITTEIEWSEIQKTKIIETALDWLIGNEKVACKANAIKIITHFAAAFPAIINPFLELLEKNFAHQTPGFQAASRNALKRIKRAQII